MPVGFMPTTVIAPMMWGRKVPRSPSAPETSSRFQANRRRTGAAGACSIGAVSSAIRPRCLHPTRAIEARLYTGKYTSSGADRPERGPGVSWEFGLIRRWLFVVLALTAVQAHAAPARRIADLWYAHNATVI